MTALPRHPPLTPPQSTGGTIITEPIAMIRQRSIPAPREDQDRSMRVVEYAMAFIAIVVAGVLAFVR